MFTAGSLSQELLAQLAEHARAADEIQAWPAKSWKVIENLGALRWSIPREFGGTDASVVEILDGYEQLASACLTTCFILTQRDGACRRIVSCGRKDLCAELLPPLASGARFATVGLSQLTTSRQHGKPVFFAREADGGFVLEGTIPWVTGVSAAQHIVVGASLEDGRQLLVALPTDSPGLSIGKPLDLMALEGSLTAEVCCKEVFVDRHFLLAGPVEKVMQGKQGGTGGLQTSCLAIGLASAAVRFLNEEAKIRPGLADGAQRLSTQLQKLRRQLHELAETDTLPADATTNLRAQANQLAVQASQAALIAAKGTGFVRDHPAQRWVRQAMFFLVWSCPWPAASATLDYLTFRTEQECAG